MTGYLSFKPASRQPLIGQLLIAHGAGAGCHSEFMQSTAELLAARGIATWMFDFPYMQLMVAQGKRRPPDRLPKLITAFKSAIVEVLSSSEFDTNLGLYIGGKSMGGRVATHLLTDQCLRELEQQIPIQLIKGGLILGYPFTPPGKQNLRTEHFEDIERPVMIVQGQRDAFGGQALLAELNLPASISTIILADGDHSFKPRKASGKTLESNMELMANSTVEWMCRINS